MIHKSSVIDKEAKIDKVDIKKKPKTLIDFLRHGSKKEDKTNG